jgi:uncharacterized protein (TIGR03435 family)
MKNRICLLLSSLLLTLGSSSQIQGAEPTVGTPPPPLQLEKLLQAPADAQASWDALKGKVVVLEFWATWCGPCIAAIPHLNELADEFKDKPVQFIAITDEDEKVVAPFLKRKPIHAWIGLDNDKSMHKDYDISSIPHTVVIDGEGKVAAITYPMALTQQHLNDLLAGKKLHLASPARGEGLRAGQLPGSKAEPDQALFQVMIRPSDGANPSSASGQGNITALGSTLLDLLSSSYGINSVRIVTNVFLPEGKFDYVVKTPTKKNETARQWLRQAVETTFGLTARRETRTVDVYLLTATEASATKLTPTVSTGGSSSSSGPGQMRGVNISLSAIAGSLESRVKKPVLNETKLTERIDFELKWDSPDDEHPDVATLAKALREQLGLDLTPAKRSVEVLIVDEAKNEDVGRPAPVGRVP